MANNYRGAQTAGGISGYVGVDEDGIGDGAGKSRPASTGLQNRLQGNTMYLAEGASCISFAPICANTTLTGSGAASGDRPWTSLAWSSILVCHIPVSPGFRGIRFNGVYNCQEANSTATNDVELKVVLGSVVRDSVDNAAFTLASTQATSQPDFNVMFTDPADGEILLPEAVSRNGTLRFEIWVRGDDGGDTAITTTTTYGGFWAQADNSTDYDQEGSGPFESGGGTPLEVCKLVETTGLYAVGNIEKDLLYPVTVGSNDTMAVHPIPLGYAAQTVSTKISYLMFIQLRGMWIRPLYEITSATPPVVANPQTGMLANTPFTATPMLRMVKAMRDIQTRPRLLAVGPEGILDSTSGREKYHGRKYPIRWPFKDADETTDETSTIRPPLIEQCVFVDAEDPYIVVHCGFIACHMRGNVFHSQENFMVAHEGTALDQTLGRADWSFELKIHQLEDPPSADTEAVKWYTATQKTNLVDGIAEDTNTGEVFTETLQLWPAGYTSSLPFLRQQAFLESFESGTDLAFSHREGSLFQEDLGLIQWRKFRVKLDNMATKTQTQYPIRVRLEASISGTPHYASSLYNELARVRLVLVGFSIWQEGAL